MVSKLKENCSKLLEKYSPDIEFTTKTLNTIFSHYTETHRAYHNLTHINDILNTLTDKSLHLQNPDLIYLAVWFHDIIYDPQSKENETRSAEFASKSLKHTSLEKQQIEYIEELIIATAKHNWFDNQLDSAYFLDADLSILGSEADKYDLYTSQIRKEYISFPDSIYYSGRKKVMIHFLERENIYYSKFFQDKFEAQARKNIQREIESYS